MVRQPATWAVLAMIVCLQISKLREHHCAVMFMLAVVGESPPCIVSNSFIFVCICVQASRSAHQQSLPKSASQSPSTPVAFIVSTFILYFILCSVLQLCLQSLQI